MTLGRHPIIICAFPIHASFYEIMIPLDSGISHTFNGITYPLEKNDIVLVPPGVPHQSIYPPMPLH